MVITVLTCVGRCHVSLDITFSLILMLQLRQRNRDGVPPLKSIW